MISLGLLSKHGRGRATTYHSTTANTTTQSTPQTYSAQICRPLMFREDREDSYNKTDLTAWYEYPTHNLKEDILWQCLCDTDPTLQTLSGEPKAIFSYAFTELVNNVIDHAQSPEIQVGVLSHDQKITLRIIDQGIGIFKNVQSCFDLKSEIEAVAEISKGKTTTNAEQHTGEGVFFVSKAATLFSIASHTTVWIVDNTRNDTAIKHLATHLAGTHVMFEATPHLLRPLKTLFNEYCPNYRFSRTKIHIHLFETGSYFVSRSEAKRITERLDQFETVILDFAGITGIGQGFADQLFRVWQREHPKVKLRPINMNQEVDFMIRHVTAGQSE